MTVHRRLLDRDPNYRKQREWIENVTLARKRTRVAKRAGTTAIPVVVHVVYQAATENISAEQISSQIAVLNQDYTKTNSDAGSIPPVWRDLAANAEIVFKLADRDPSGTGSDGITRSATAVAGFTDDDAVKSAGSGGADPWPSDRYLNIWVCKLQDLLGYAQFPGGPAQTDGVVIDFRAFGTSGTATSPYHLGRTATHEIGHWLNLFHIWGDDGAGCAGSDQVDDTPNQAGPNTGVPTFPHVTCENGPNGDIFVNFMDYVDDNTMTMFTSGQVDRMHAALDEARPTFPVGGQPDPSPTGGWIDTDLTIEAGAPDAASPPVVASAPSATLSVFYLGVDHHIHALRPADGGSNG